MDWREMWLHMWLCAMCQRVKAEHQRPAGLIPIKDTRVEVRRD
jgi:hypothetical protein